MCKGAQAGDPLEYDRIEKERIKLAESEITDMRDFPWQMHKETIQGITLKLVV